MLVCLVALAQVGQGLYLAVRVMARLEEITRRGFVTAIAPRRDLSGHPPSHIQPVAERLSSAREPLRRNRGPLF